MLKGGHGGKVGSKYPKTKEWNYFSSAYNHVSTFNKLLTICERENRNEKAFSSIRVYMSNEKNTSRLRKRNNESRYTPYR